VNGVNSEPQYLHLMAASWICSAQNGHFFISNPYRDGLAARG
jgi:hypothetical protein